MSEPLLDLLQQRVVAIAQGRLVSTTTAVANQSWVQELFTEEAKQHRINRQYDYATRQQAERQGQTRK